MLTNNDDTVSFLQRKRSHCTCCLSYNTLSLIQYSIVISTNQKWQASTMTKKSGKTLIIDGSNFLWRSFHAIRQSYSGNQPLNIVEGLISIVLKPVVMRAKADDIAVVFDHPSPSFRNQIYSQYKAHRPPAPEEFTKQILLSRQAVESFNIACVEIPGFEADDTIASLARIGFEKGHKVTIATPDKDLMQLVNDRVFLYNQKTRAIIKSQDVFDYFGVMPEKVVDVQSLCGDTTDGVPGVPGIGKKIASALINEFGDLETLLDNRAKIQNNRIRRLIDEHIDNIDISKQLVTLRSDVFSNVNVPDISRKPFEREKAAGFILDHGLPQRLIL